MKKTDLSGVAAFISRIPRSERIAGWLKNSRRAGPWLTSLTACFALVFTLVTLLLPKKTFSEKENRKLADPPVFSLSALWNGDYTDGIGAWFADHFVGRDRWIASDLQYKRLLGFRENGGVWLGKKKTQFLIPSAPNETALEKNLSAMDAFAADHSEVNTYVAVIPNACEVLKNRLPANAPAPDQAAYLQRIAGALPNARFLNVTEALTQHREDDIFYKTDHHWTSYGAYLAFLSMAGEMGIDAPITEYDIYPVSTVFTGTLASKSGCFNTTDTVELYVPKTDVVYAVTYVSTLQKSASIYDESALETKDKYTVFFGGNHPRVDISTTSESGRRLLLFKDSYANCFVQFLFPYFEEIVMVDPRYYYDNADPLMTQHSITDVLYLYNCDTFMTDTSIADVLAPPAERPSPTSPVQTEQPAEQTTSEQAEE